MSAPSTQLGLPFESIDEAKARPEMGMKVAREMA
jgi:hypothetical protein